MRVRSFGYINLLMNATASAGVRPPDHKPKYATGTGGLSHLQQRHTSKHVA